MDIQLENPLEDILYSCLSGFGLGKKNTGNLQTAFCRFTKCQPYHPYIKPVSSETWMPV